MDHAFTLLSEAKQVQQNRRVSPLLQQVFICFLQSKRSRGTEERSTSISSSLSLALSKDPAPLEKELWGFSRSGPSLKAQVVLHTLSLLMVWLQTHNFVTLGYICLCFASSCLPPFCSLHSYSSRSQIYIEI